MGKRRLPCLLIRDEIMKPRIASKRAHTMVTCTVTCALKLQNLLLISG